MVDSKFIELTYKAKNKYQDGFFFSALYGSQNYGLANENSDVDVKVAFLPSVKELLLNQKRIATTLTEEGSTDNAVLAKDLRDFFSEFYKENLNFLEVLATPWCSCSAKYKDLFVTLRDRNDEVARYYERGFYLCTCGLFNKLNTNFEKERFDYKKFAFGLYLKDFLDLYDMGVTFKNCFKSPNAAELKKLKCEQYLTEKQCLALWQAAKADMDNYFTKANKMSAVKNDRTKKWMDDLLLEYVLSYIHDMEEAR